MADGFQNKEPNQGHPDSISGMPGVLEEGGINYEAHPATPPNPSSAQKLVCPRPELRKQKAKSSIHLHFQIAPGLLKVCGFISSAYAPGRHV